VQDTSFTLPSTFRAGFTVGEVLGRGFGVVYERPLLMLGLAFAGLAPIFLAGMVAAIGIDFAAVGAAGISALPLWVWPAFVVVLLLSVVPGTAIIHATVEHLQGRTPAFGASLAVGFQRVLPVLIIHILYCLAIFAGSILLIVPGLMLACMFFVAAPVAIVERRGIFASFGRARALSKGYRVTMFALGVATIVILIAFGVALEVYGWLTGAIGGVAGPAVAMVLTLPVTVVGQLVQTAVLPALAAATYVGLVEEKEVGTADQVAGVFS
jgi:hypothetical protein